MFPVISDGLTSFDDSDLGVLGAHFQGWAKEVPQVAAPYQQSSPSRQALSQSQSRIRIAFNFKFHLTMEDEHKMWVKWEKKKSCSLTVVFSHKFKKDRENHSR